MADWQGNAEPEEYADSRNYCEHGTFVGNWATGDYLCGWCEDGTPWEEYQAYCIHQEIHALRRNLLATVFTALSDCTIGGTPYEATAVGIFTGLAYSLR